MQIKSMQQHTTLEKELIWFYLGCHQIHIPNNLSVKLGILDLDLIYKRVLEKTKWVYAKNSLDILFVSYATGVRHS